MNAERSHSDVSSVIEIIANMLRSALAWEKEHGDPPVESPIRSAECVD